jgi:hypothetical protein
MQNAPPRWRIVNPAEAAGRVIVLHSVVAGHDQAIDLA